MKPLLLFVPILLLAFAPAFSAPASELTNLVRVTTNMTCYLQAVHEAAGPKTEFKSHQEIAAELMGTSTNYVWSRSFPYGGFDFHLFDENGKEVRKSKAGLDMTATPPQPTFDDLRLTRKFPGGAVSSTAGAYIPLFRPDDVFMITSPGNYELEFRLRLCVIMTNGQPDLAAMVGSFPRNITLVGIRTNNQFGILTSPPLRVRVVKESSNKQSEKPAGTESK